MFLSTAGEAAQQVMIFGMSHKFWIVVLIMALFIGSILTSSYNDDKTKGL
ncbi:hypothetical protein [Cohnella cellulosilytica]|uniref:Uncharacterized protein n=1 Tax=Cohnella cellulosilytica TaxID=986710 RepID=A0ABW2FAY3_9BACL